MQTVEELTLNFTFSLIFWDELLASAVSRKIVRWCRGELLLVYSFFFDYRS